MRLADLLGTRPDVEPDDPPEIRGRRRTASALTVVVAGALLGATLRVDEGSTGFTVLGLLTASTWIAGALASGPIPIRPRAPRPVVASIARAAGVGAAAFVVFLAASLVAQRVPGLSGALDSILDRADAGPRWVVLGVALLNGVGEELFFRGAVHAAVGHRRVLTTTAVYVAVTLATGNLALVAAAAVMGALLGAVRQATGGVAAPIATHLTWSTLMVLLLPR